MATSGATTRATRSDDRLYRAAVQLLHDGGVGAVTVEAVAAASGVAKTTIYRRHSDRNDLLRAALESVCTPLELFDTGAPKESLLLVLTTTCQTIETFLGRSASSVILGGEEPTVRYLTDEILQPRIDAMAALLRAAVDNGELRHGTDSDLLLDMILGALTVHQARVGSFSQRWPAELVDLVWSLAGTAEARATERAR